MTLQLLDKPGLAVPVTVARSPFQRDSRTLSALAGASVMDILLDAVSRGELQFDHLSDARVYVGGIEIPYARWEQVRPKAGISLAVIIEPQGGGGKSPLRIFLEIAVIALTAWVGGGALVPLLGSGFAAGTVGAAVAAAGTSLAGGLLVNALTGKSTGNGRTGQAYSISGARNTATPYATAPVILGKRRFVPPLAAALWSEVDGDDVYQRMLVAWHHGRCSLSDIKIGETPIDQYDGVEIQHRLSPDDDFPSLYDRVVREEPYQILLQQADGYTSRTTRTKTTSISCDLGWPTGLLKNTSDGQETSTVEVHVQYRQTGTSTWLDAPVGVDGVVTFTEKKDVPFRRTIGPWDVDEGQYDVQWARLTADRTGTKTADIFYLVALRSFGDGLPVLNDDLAVTALRIKASDQIQGVVDELNAVVQIIAPVWDEDTSNFTGNEETSNPAAIAHFLMTGCVNARPLSGSKIDGTALGAWSELADEKGWRCDHLLDDGTTLEQALWIVAGTGRAFPIWKNALASVSVDYEKPAPVQVFSDRNVKNFKGSVTFPEPIHAVNVEFNDETANYERATRTVYANGYDETNASLFEDMEATGKTQPAEAYVAGWLYLATRNLRPESYTFDTFTQGLVASIGSRVLVRHDAILVGIKGARVTGVVTSGGDVTAIDIDEEITLESGKDYVFRAQSGSVINLYTLAGDDNVTTSRLVLSAPIDADAAPVAGDHGVFGEAGKETLDAVVIGIKRKTDLSCTLVCIPYAPELQADGGDIPSWDPLITPRNSSLAITGRYVPPDVDLAARQATLSKLHEIDAGYQVGDQALQDQIDSITPIADEALAHAPGVGPSLPGTPPDSGLFFNTSDGQLYRWFGGDWTVAVPTDALTGTIARAQLAAGIIDKTKIAAGLSLPSVVSSLPSVTTSNNGDLAYLTTDGKLYRVVAGAWSRAVDGADIVANSITAGTIAAGAIGTTQLAASAVTASKLYVGDTSNLVPDPGFSDAAAWSFFGIGAVLIADAQAATLNVAKAARHSRTPQTNQGTSQVISQTFLVEPGKAYRVLLNTLTFGSFSGLGRAAVFWYDSTGASISTSSVFGTDHRTVPASSLFSESIEGQVTAPTNAYSAQFASYVTWNTGTSNGYLYTGNPRMMRAADGQLVVDGTITGAKIAANTITASNILANTITAGIIAAGAIGTTQLAAGAITAAKLSAGCINASTLIANNIILKGHILDQEITTRLSSTAWVLASGTITSKTSIGTASYSVDSGLAPIIVCMAGWIKVTSGSYSVQLQVNPTHSYLADSAGLDDTFSQMIITDDNNANHITKVFVSFMFADTPTTTSPSYRFYLNPNGSVTDYYLATWAWQMKR